MKLLKIIAKIAKAVWKFIQKCGSAIFASIIFALLVAAIGITAVVLLLVRDRLEPKYTYADHVAFPYVMVGVGIASVILLIICFIVRHKKKKEELAKAGVAPVDRGQAPGSPQIGSDPHATAGAVASIAPDDLVTAWKSFLSVVPSDFKRVIRLYQPFIVVGGMGSGKSSLIGKYTDWQGLASQFYPSYSLDPKLQLYLGPQAVVQEMCPEVFNDTTKSTRQALKKLWKRSLGGTAPVVIATVPAEALVSASQENLRNLAQLTRGKINVLAWVRREAIRTRVAVTGLEQIPGYVEFARLLTEEGIAFEIDVEKYSSKELVKAIQKYERYLPVALTKLSSQDYLKVISFFQRAPEIFSRLAGYIKVLRASDSLSPLPVIEYVTLTSGCADEKICNPFAVPPIENITQAWSRARHRMAAGIIGALGLAYLGTAFGLEHAALDQSQAELNKLKKSMEVRYNKGFVEAEKLTSPKDHHQEFEAQLVIPANYKHLKFFPSFHCEGRDAVAKEVAQLCQEYDNWYVKCLRQGTFIPQLLSYERATTSKHEETIYLVGLMYARANTKLGGFVLNNTNSFSDILGYNEALIRNYVEASRRKFTETMDLAGNPHVIALDDDLMAPWQQFIRELARLCKKETISAAELCEAQEDCQDLRIRARKLRSKAQFLELIGLLTPMRSVELPIFLEQRPAALAQVSNEELKQLLNAISQSKLDIPSTGDLSLRAFLRLANGILEKETSESEIKTFDLGSEKTEFELKAWRDLLRNTRLALLVDDFARKNGEKGYKILFDKGEVHDDIMLNHQTEEQFLFRGRPKLQGIYTEAAFRESVVPAIKSYTMSRRYLPIPKYQSALLERVVANSVRVYAREYESELRAFAETLQIKAESNAELRLLLKQMQAPGSTFLSYLNIIHQHSQIVIPKDDLFQPMHTPVREFRYLKALMTEQDGHKPYLEEYFTILSMMLGELEGVGTSAVAKKPADPKGKTEGEGKEAPEAKAEAQAEPKPTPDTMAGQLTPLARISLSIYRNDADSYQKLIAKWLKNLAVSPRYQSQFLAPTVSAYRLGIADVQKQVNVNWDKMLHGTLIPMASMFPFNPKAEESISPTELTELLGHEGSLWETFGKQLGPVCELKDGKYVAVAKVQDIVLPKDLLPSMNRLRELHDVLWQTEGQPRSLVVNMKSTPLPMLSKLGEFEAIVVLAFFNSGESSVLAFNQYPSWQKLVFDWWRPHVSTVGVQFSSADSSDAVFSAVNTNEKDWAFLRLLHLGKQVRDRVWTWHIEIDEALKSLDRKAYKKASKEGPLPRLPVSYEFQQSPSLLFRLDFRWAKRAAATVRPTRKKHEPKWTVEQPEPSKKKADKKKADKKKETKSKSKDEESEDSEVKEAVKSATKDAAKSLLPGSK